MSKFQLAGRQNGDPKISVVVLNDEISVHSNGATTMTVQRIRTECEVSVTARSPPDAGGRRRASSARSSASLRYSHVGHASSIRSLPPRMRLTMNTMAANSRVTIASTTPMALARPALPSMNAVLNSSWVITRVE